MACDGATVNLLPSPPKNHPLLPPPPIPIIPWTFVKNQPWESSRLTRRSNSGAERNPAILILPPHFAEGKMEFSGSEAAGLLVPGAGHFPPPYTASNCKGEVGNGASVSLVWQSSESTRMLTPAATAEHAPNTRHAHQAPDWHLVLTEQREGEGRQWLGGLCAGKGEVRGSLGASADGTTCPLSCIRFPSGQL